MGERIETMYLRYDFTEDEKKKIAEDMARKLTQLRQKQDDKKAIAAELKGEIDSLQAEIALAATRFNNGYEMRDVKCKVRPDWDQKTWEFIRDDTGEIAKIEKMTADDLQQNLRLAVDNESKKDNGD